jgi:hypothetical protein
MMWVTEVRPQKEWAIGRFAIEESGHLCGNFGIAAGIQEVDSIGERAELIFIIDAAECW